MTKPCVGDRRHIRLTEPTYSAAAVGRIDDVVTFVDGGAAGDTALVEITSAQKRHLRARIAKLISPSPDRCPPPCAYFVDGCGGCQWQHIQTDAQLRAKAHVLREALKRIGQLKHLPDIVTHAAPQPLHYRNNLRLMVTSVQPRIEFGFRQEGSHNVVPVDRCAIALPAINDALPHVANLVKDLHVPHVQELAIRASSATAETLLILIFPKHARPRLNITDTDLRRYPGIHGVFTRRGERAEAVWIAGKKRLSERVGGLCYRLGPDAFFQNNLAGLEQLLKIVCERVKLTSPVVAIDAHCGVGAFTLPVAQLSQYTLGIDLHPATIELATENARMNGITQVDFRVGRLSQLRKIRADLVMLDPPRGGCRPEDLDALKRISPPQILYISCNPTTLARDLSRLKQEYEICTLDLVDLFPMTYHFETVAWLRKF